MNVMSHLATTGPAAVAVTVTVVEQYCKESATTINDR